MLFESLESRSYLSGSSITVEINTDQVNVRSALQHFRSDAETAMAKMLADEEALRNYTIKKNPLLAPLFTAFGKEVKVVGQAVGALNPGNSSAVVTDTSAVAVDLKQYAADSGNSSAQSVDSAQLRADRMQLEKDDIAQVNAQLAASEADLTALTNDINTIVAKVEASDVVSHVSNIDINKFLTDHTSGLSSALSALNALSNARTQLAAALTADVNVAA